MNSHSKGWPPPHPAIKRHVLLLLLAKNFTEVPFLSLSLQYKDIISYPDLARALLLRFIIDRRSQNEQVGNMNRRTPMRQTFKNLFVLMAECSNVKNQHLF